MRCHLLSLILLSPSSANKLKVLMCIRLDEHLQAVNNLTLMIFSPLIKVWPVTHFLVNFFRLRPLNLTTLVTIPAEISSCTTHSRKYIYSNLFSSIKMIRVHEYCQLERTFHYRVARLRHPLKVDCFRQTKTKLSKYDNIA